MMVIWITGLSGSGKSTLARALRPLLKGLEEAVIFLDGDDLRTVFQTESQDKNHYDRSNRLQLANRYARLGKLLSDQGFTVVITTISLFHEVHDWNRANISNYLEVYLKVPVDELRRRDPKGLYKKFDEGLVQHIAGLDLDIEEPENPDILIEFDPDRSVEDIAEDVLQHIQRGQTH